MVLCDNHYHIKSSGKQPASLCQRWKANGLLNEEKSTCAKEASNTTSSMTFTTSAPNLKLTFNKGKSYQKFGNFSKFILC